ncbi:MAG: hypothetical protein ACW98K_03910 [Candidatus Kariarchaeaceae archaeon]|jgi:hypothetical protein
MSVSFSDTVVALSSLTIIVIGFLMAVVSIKIYREKRSTLVLLSSILFFTLPSPWMPDVFVYFAELMGGSISNTTAAYLSAWSIPIFVTTWLYITGSLLRDQPWAKYVALVVGAIPGLIFYIKSYIYHDWTVTTIEDSKLLAVEYSDGSNLIIIFYGLAGLVFIFPMNVYFAIKSRDQLFKFRTSMISAGVLLYALSAVFDAIFEFENTSGIILVRFFILLSMICLFTGYITPNRIRERFVAETG